MTEREKIVEVMARGQYAANCWWRPVEDDDDATGRYKAGHDGDLFRAIEWGQLCKDERKELLDAASAALTALEASGMAVVQKTAWPPHVSFDVDGGFGLEWDGPGHSRYLVEVRGNADVVWIVRQDGVMLHGNEHKVASSDGKAPAPEGSAEAQNAVAHSPTPSVPDDNG